MVPRRDGRRGPRWEGQEPFCYIELVLDDIDYNVGPATRIRAEATPAPVAARVPARAGA